jgi:caffeoyl-CoA O-methyltransferase
MALSRDHGPVLSYITRTFVEEPEWIIASRGEGDKRRPGMQVSAYEGYLLSWLVRISGAKRILEIGTFMATSTLWMAEGAGDTGRITALEFDEEYAVQAQKNVSASPHAPRIEIVQGDAKTWIAAQPNTPTFDLVFIDADKLGYAGYLEAILPRMKPHGWILGDNTLLFGVMTGENPDGASAAAKASMTKFNETLADASRFESVLLPTPEGLTVARLK